MVTTRSRNAKRNASSAKPPATQKRRRPAPTPPPATIDHPSHGKVEARVLVWGEGCFGQLGLGEDITERARPFPIKSLEDKVIDVKCGGVHSVALMADGQVLTWGVNDEGALGRPAAGTAWEELGHSDLADATVPGPVEFPQDAGRILQISAGDSHTLALTEHGTVWGWGTYRDNSGIMGFQPATRIQLSPVKIYHPEEGRRCVQIASGANHSLALLENGHVLSWGEGGQGQLGRLGSRTVLCDDDQWKGKMLTPAAVLFKKSWLQNDKVVSVCCGEYSSLFITENGSVLVTGLNNYQQLGVKTKRERTLIYVPEKPRGLQGKGICALSAGMHHTIALTISGKVLAVGRTLYGRLGVENADTKTDGMLGDLQTVGGLEGMEVEGVAAGPSCSGCFGKGGGQMLAWGQSENYQLGNGDDDKDEIVPAQMKITKHFKDTNKVVKMDFGGQHGAALVVDIVTEAGPSGEPAVAE